MNIGLLLRHLSLGVLLLILLGGAALADEQPAGVVIIASGTFQAIGRDGTPRSLVRRAPFFAGDLLRLGDDGKAQVRFVDGTVISLRPGTELRVDAFRYEDGGGKQDRSFFTLLKGGFRTITGAIGKKHPETHRVTTPVATIGVRGTVYSAILAGDLYVGVWQGGITVKNDGGALDLGLGAAYDFARISGTDAAPHGLATPPPVLLDTVAPDSAHDARPSADEQPAQSAAETGTEGRTAEADRPQVSEDQTSRSTLTPAAIEDQPASDGLLTERDSTPITTIAATATEPLNQIIEDDRNRDGIPDALSNGTNILTDTRLTGAELASLDRAGLALIDDTRLNTGLAGGPLLANASDGAGGNPILVHRTLDPITGFPANLLRQGSAPLTNNGADPMHFRVDNATNVTLPVSWGTWNEALSDMVPNYDNPSDPLAATAINSPVHWLTVLPTDPGVISALTGLIAYTSPIAFFGSSSSGALSTPTAVLTVDFDAASVTGNVNFMSGGNAWNIDFNGALSGPALDITSVTGNFNGSDPLAGAVNGFLTGPQAEGVAGAFDVESSLDPAIHAEGVFVLGCGTACP